MAITLAVAQANLDDWLAASASLAQGKSYTLANGVSVTHEGAKQVQAMITYWNNITFRLSGGGRSMTRRIIPLDI
jgi:hypothetical protein